MLRIGIFPNKNKPLARNILNTLLQLITERGGQGLLPESLGTDWLGDQAACPDETLREQIDVAITLGGDGTLLSVSRRLACSGIPILGINLGQLGFLADVEVSELAQSMDCLFSGTYTLQQRIMVEAWVERGTEREFLSYAMNEVVVTKSGFSRLIDLEIAMKCEPVTKFSADGVIVATPTGSTGYSLSAGGPIVHPELDVLLLTPICSNTLHARPFVIPGHEELCIRVPAPQGDILVTADGQNGYHVQPGEAICIRRAAAKTPFIRLPGTSYYEALRRKLWRNYEDRD